MVECRLTVFNMAGKHSVNSLPEWDWYLPPLLGVMRSHPFFNISGDCARVAPNSSLYSVILLLPATTSNGSLRNSTIHIASSVQHSELTSTALLTGWCKILIARTRCLWCTVRASQASQAKWRSCPTIAIRICNAFSPVNSPNCQTRSNFFQDVKDENFLLLNSVRSATVSFFEVYLDACLSIFGIRKERLRLFVTQIQCL